MFLRRRLLGTALLFVVSVSAALSAQISSSVYEQVGSAFEHSKFSEAEQLLRPALEEHPDDSRALGLMGVILDAQKRYKEAESFYQQALRLDPNSAALLNNLGNHYLESGQTERAREAYLKVVALEPGHPNANLHLAQMSVAAKNGDAALQYLVRLPAPSQSDPAVELLRAQALDLAGQRTQAELLIRAVEEHAGNDPRISFSAGLVLVTWQHYDEAEKAFTRALDASPANFDILYNLGLAAARAGHLARALDIFQIALTQRPDDVDCLYSLARVYDGLGQDDQAVLLLFNAEQLAPHRPDVVMLTAHVSEALGYYSDAAVAYDRYLTLQPGDDIARRERGFALARGAKLQEGLVDLRWYVEKHPRDARGLYELGVAETIQERPNALEHLNRAIALDPKFTVARYARAVLLYQDGMDSDAVQELLYVLKLEPNDFRALDQLGAAYLTIGRPRDAVEVLGRAAALAPDDPKVLAHYSRALLRIGRTEQGEEVLAQFQKVQSDPVRRRPSGGLFEFLRLPPAEQQARYMATLQRQIAMNASDPNLKVRLGKALFAQGKIEEGLAAFRGVRALTSDPKTLNDCAQVLMEYQQFGLARDFLQTIVGADPSASDARLDLAAATFHSTGAEAGMAVLDQAPPGQRKGDYYLLRAQILDAMGKLDEATADLNRGFLAAPTHSDLYFQAALFLIKHEQYNKAIAMLQQTNRVVPDSPNLLLTEAITYELLQQPENAQRILARIELQWPEWGEPYLINGILLETRFKSAPAKLLLETAISLGETNSRAYYYLALATTHADPDDSQDAQKAIDEALKLDDADPYIHALAGRIAYNRRNYPAAVEQLTAALRLWPDMIEARQTLSATYRALGDPEKAADELREVLRIKQATSGADQAPPSPVRSLLFSVRPLAEVRPVGNP
jgi:tetratricopeptide (TPR) repeat protein